MMQSFGHYPSSAPNQVIRPSWQDEIRPMLQSSSEMILPIGMRKSYGDSCLNNGGTMMDLTSLRKIISFDAQRGVLCVEAGITLKEILALIVPHGWFLPVSPGTQYITIGGAIANDIHGKNHHLAGSFGNHVLRIGLQRSDMDEVLMCSEHEHRDLFTATIGGLGLTGIIVWAEFKLTNIPSAMMKTRTERFIGYDEFSSISLKQESSTYSVSWFDSISGGKNFMRGLFNSGEFIDHPFEDIQNVSLNVPFFAPAVLLNEWSMKAFNTLYYRKNLHSISEQINHYIPFFYPLDSVNNWNKLYGKRGFLQYQCVIPHDNARDCIQDIVHCMQHEQLGSFLVVLKAFGSIPSRGLLSFPMPGMTLAMDFPMRGETTLRILSQFDKIVDQAGGRVYPAKDARMSGEHFRSWYPGYEQMLKIKDPMIESSFWRRVMQ